jgi:hypothetical protein
VLGALIAPDNGSVYLIMAAPVFLTTFAFGREAWPSRTRGGVIRAGLCAYITFMLTLFGFALFFIVGPDIPTSVGVLSALLGLSVYGFGALIVAQERSPLAVTWSIVAFASASATGLTWLVWSTYFWTH